MSIQSPRILDAKQRAWQYWFVDGFTHVLLGLALLSISICELFPPRPRAFWQLGLWAALLGLYLALMLWQRQILEWLKTKITYPRTGYVQPPFDAMSGAAGIVELGLEGSDEHRAEAERLAADHRKRLLLAASLVVAGSLGMLLTENRWAPAVVSVLLASALWILRKREKVSWITIVGIPVFGVFMTVFVAPGAYPPHSMAWLMAAWGGLFVLEGTIALTRYLLQNPPLKVAEP
jgi:hypothetical protein